MKPAQSDSQEPVAWVDKVWVERLDIAKQLRIELLFSRCQLSHNQIPFYTAPPRKPWVGLTEDEQYQIVTQCGAMSADWQDFVIAVEQKLKDKNDTL